MTALIKINDKLSIAGQIALEDFATLAGLGYKAVVNNRPEGEEASQPASTEEAEAAANAGLAYAHIPVTGPSITEQDVRALQDVLARTDGPVLAHCRSGTRSLTLFSIGEVLDGRMKREDLPAFGAEHGVDMRMADGWLARNGH
ncbi:TIGR01244 family sulfur transferase [Kaistia defluvii]|uniref:TIGR01244 family sulfur transferase n=1 Tax=Kaistia defluvii TaxID=410841 RepID=UPI002258C4AD|nr:TIGR01244 family sulfur transferase [Kaistia defluvii]MCX5519092.1 TIGR01244 family sulfur transferase [Kaistia defluvii]